MKEALKAITPPVVWNFARKFAGKKPTDHAQRHALSLAQDGVFSVAYRQVEFNDNAYFVPGYAEHRPAAKAIANGELYEPATHVLVKRLLEDRPGSMVHAGTFFGDMVPTFAKACPKTLYAFEPVLENYVLAKLGVEANSLDNVVLTNAGLGTEIMPARIDIGGEDGEHRGGSSKIALAGQATALTRIDALGLDDLSLLQLDVEGFELHALNGARETVDRCSPVILVEDNDNTCRPFFDETGYVSCGTIPGLKIWSKPADKDRVSKIVSAL